MGRKYALGLDFGSLSGRAILVDIKNGQEIASVVKTYQHGFIEDYLPGSGEKLPPDWTLQDPQDYLDVLSFAVPEVIRTAGIKSEDIIGVGVDFTSSTCLPVKMDGTPLCQLPAFKDHKHAYVKKWKHHAAQHKAQQMTDTALARDESFIRSYGGKVSSEWMIPKLWQLVEEAPDVYEQMDLFMEANDWIVMQLTGQLTRNSCSAGYKAFWNKQQGFPSFDYYCALDPGLADAVKHKLKGRIIPAGTKAGEITGKAAGVTGLTPGTAVSAGHIDAHVAMPAAGITEPGKMLMIMGTSICHLVLSNQEKQIPGICGVVEDGILPGYFGYEAGQSCVGDLFDWFVQNQVPSAYYEEAVQKKISIHALLREKVMHMVPGETGLLALDWWNGNRSVLVDFQLTGMIIGLTMASKPEDIYRTLLESTAFGTRRIIDQFVKAGVSVNSLTACGGIALKDPLMMQIFADVTNREIEVSDHKQTVALGAAMYGAVAAGKQRGGYDKISEAATVMPRLQDKIYKPVEAHAVQYDCLYREYAALHDYFGCGTNDVMKRLKTLSHQIKSKNTVP